MERKYFFRQLAAALIVLLAGASPALAWEYESTNIKDEGGGTYNFRIENRQFKYDGKNRDCDKLNGFKTIKRFDVDKDQFYFEYQVRLCPEFIITDEYAMRNTMLEGEILLVTADGVSHKVETWYHKKENAYILTGKWVSKAYGRFAFTYLDTKTGTVNIQYAPNNSAYHEGVKQIIFKGRLVFKDTRQWGYYQYEKDIDMSSITDNKPMPQATFEWNDNGEIVAKATDVKDQRNNPNYISQFYQLRDYFFDWKTNYRLFKDFTFATDRGNMTITDRVNGKMDLEFTFWKYTHKGVERTDGAYTTPVRIKYNAAINVKPNMRNKDVTSVQFYQPDQWVLVQPYTRPVTVRVDFDKWKKTNTITWTRQEQVTGFDGGRTWKDDCRFDGMWYVIRYEKGASPTDYTEIGVLNGKANTLKLTDDRIDYDADYVYRVVFLPDVLEEKFSKKLTELPGQSETHYKTDLWEETSVSTKMEIPVKLAQDRSDDSGIRLTWEYNVQANGCEWRIDKHRLGTTTWQTVTTIPVDVKQSTAAYLEEGGSVCDLYVYRIMTKINGKELYSDTLVCNLPAGAYISQVEATTGIKENYVEVTWKVARPGDDDISFRVLRRPIGEESWTLLTDKISGHASEYTYTDDRVMAGSYYEYSVEAYGAKCEGQLVQTDQQVAPGFSQARGTITGHISYGTGTAVADAQVMLVKSSADESTDQPQFLSRYIDGAGKGLRWTAADKTKVDTVLCANGEFTIQFWARPQTVEAGGAANQTILRLANGLELGVNSDDGTQFYLNSTVRNGTGVTTNNFGKQLLFSTSDFTHVTAVYSHGQMTCYVGADTLLSMGCSLPATGWDIEGTPTLAIGGITSLSAEASGGGQTFTGYIDDIRLWNRALTPKEINSNYTRILGGSEAGLILYWPLDEGINVRNYAFDVTCKDGIYQLNHPEVGINATPSATTPKLLGLFGVTDSEGDYIIRGIPFQQGGTNYKLVPLLGIHEFSPSTRSMFISPTSLTANNIDFEDVSSFPMTGHIYYAGTNIPAEGVQFYVDGEIVTGNGEFKQTDSDGRYEISVPIGKHYVEAKLQGHTMASGGRFPTVGTFNFDRAVTFDFVDSTLVNFVGRVGGGVRNDTLAVGFGESKNNIGMATVTLKLSNETFSFNCQDDHITPATSNRTWTNDTTSINSRTWTGTGYDAKYIKIRTDSLTGEFSAMLPPLKYITKSIEVSSNPDIEFSTLPDVDLSNPIKIQTDSIMFEQAPGDTIVKRYDYNTKMIRTYFAPPQLDIVEKTNEGGAYGIQKLEDYVISDRTKSDTVTIDNIWKVEDDGTVKYLLGYPVYRMLDPYTYDLFAYETYVNADGRDRGEIVTDVIPLDGQVIDITNEMCDEQTVVYSVENEASDYKVGDVYEPTTSGYKLGADGRGTYKWKAGLPNLTSPYTRHLTASMERNGRIYVMANLDAIVLGYITQGNNFVTQGPDNIDFVLRDPPGSKSKTTLKRGHTSKTIKYDFDGGFGNESLITNNIAGSEVSIGVGLGLISITSQNITNQLDLGGRFTFDSYNSHEKVYSSSYTKAISTSAGYPYFSTKGDVYVGTSTNLLIGGCLNLQIKRGDKPDTYTLGVEEAISISSEVSTAFAYSQYELETVMIPKWKDQRKAFMTEVKDKAEADAYVNNGSKSVYLTWLKPDNKDYGKKGFYRYATPLDSTKISKSERDSVEWCTNQIQRWEDAIKDNEEDKVKCMKYQYNWENFSLDGGSSLVFANKKDTVKTNRETRSYALSGILNENFGFRLCAAFKFGTIVHINTENGRKWGTNDGDGSEEYTEWEYNLIDGNRDTDISINKYESKDDKYSYFFSVYGGQTYNPYHGADSTKYYTPKTQLNAATQQMEQPRMSISVNGQNPSKEITVTDIPSGQEQNLTLHCTNMASAHQGLNFSYNLIILENSNRNGLQILMDGVPISGRSIFLPQSETVTKQITIRQTDPSILDYEGVRLRFCSQYEAPLIFDDITINAHFIPSSSPINLAVNEPVLNQEVMARTNGSVELKLQDFNRLFKNLRYVGLQYRYEGNTQWNTIHTYVTNPKDSLNESYSPLPDAGIIRFMYDMKDDNFFPQGTYYFRAFTSTPYGQSPNDAATIYSEEVAVIKDNLSPRALTTPTPVNGILGYGEDMSVEFNEDIVPGYVSDKNVIVTAKLNHQPVSHEVSKLLRPYGGPQSTINPVFLNGDFSFDFWMKWEESGSILRHGTNENALQLGINDDGRVTVVFSGTKLVSKDAIPKNAWTYMVLSYKADDMSFSILALTDNTTRLLFDHETVSWANIHVINYSEDNYLYLGSMKGAMHDLSLFNIYRDVYEAAATRSQTKDNYVYGLANYWPMNEGHGLRAADTRHTHDFEVNNWWEIENTNYALSTNDNKGVEVDISRINTSRADSYAIELWALVPYASILDDYEQTIFETGSKASNNIRLYVNKDYNTILEYGGKSQQVASDMEEFHTGSWAHYALNVVRGQSASFYVNGKRTAVIAESDIPQMEGSTMRLAYGNEPNMQIDELRIWKATLSESRLLSNIYNCIDTTDVYSRGLTAYYPFEKTGVVNGVVTKVPTLENMAPRGNSSLPADTVKTPGLTSLVLEGPPLKNAPEETRLIASPVASERKVVIDLAGNIISPRDIEGTTLNITVADIRDQNGNASTPIKWTAYVQQNTLKWTRDSVNVIKHYGDEYTFDVDIENKGGQTEYYILNNMPEWLTLVGSERNDDVAPLKTKTLRFQVNPLVAVGQYDLTIGLQGNKGILEPLRIVMKVSGRKPEWTVDPTKYENTMSIVGQVYVNGILMENSESQVAAFIDGECRGIASPEQERGAAYVAMTVYGTAEQMVNGKPTPLDKDKKVTFRIWDATTGIAYTDVTVQVRDSISADLTFDPAKDYGDYYYPIIWTKGENVEQTIALTEGWNWISLSVAPQQKEPYNVFADLSSWNVRVKDHGTGSSYCNGSYWDGNLTAINGNTMYKMLLTRLSKSKDLPQPKTVFGRQLKTAETPIVLKKGWNWIAYIPTMTMPLNQALAAANPQNGDRVKSQTGFAIYSIYGWEGNLKALENGKGYLYYSTDDNGEKQFCYPNITAAARTMTQETGDLNTQQTATLFHPIDPVTYPDNMTLVVRLVCGADTIDTTELAAFIGDECRGATTAINGLYYLLVAGEGSGQPMELRTMIDGRELTVSSDLTYSSDANIGTPWEPLVIDMTDIMGITHVTGDYVPGVWYNIQGLRIGTAKPTTPGVYIYNGSKVVVRRTRTPK